jgi:hypothetical protein
MIDNGPATEDDMILAFLQAELPPPRFGPSYGECLRRFGRGPRIITNPDLANASENTIRKTLLTNVRAYRNAIHRESR